MGKVFRYSVLLGKRWIWILLIGAILSGSATYLVSTFLHPVYQASAYLIIDRGAIVQPDDNEDSPEISTFAQALKTPAVLGPVAELHAGMTTRELAALITVKPQSNTQTIELDVQADNPTLAVDLANQVSQSFAQYTSSNSSGTVRIITAQEPSLPIQPHSLAEAGVGVVIGFFLMLILVILLERMRDRATSVEQIQELLATEIMALVPHFSRRSTQLATSEKYHMICAGLNVARAKQPFKLVMFTSALAGEGKSTVACNVAIHLAQIGKQVLLVDLNIHHPVLAQLFRLNNQLGLTNLLAEKNERLQLEACSQVTDTAGLHVLTSGSQHMSFSELLQSLIATQFFSRLQQTAFDYIIFDAPPLFAVTETRTMASSMEAIVLVVNGSRTPCRVLERTRQVLWRVQTSRFLGAVVNHSSWSDYADTHPYTLPSPHPESDVRDEVERVTVEIPALATMLLPVTKVAIEPQKKRLPDTGETEQVVPRVPEYIIRPSLSLSGLAVPDNGLTRRVFHSEVSPDVPRSLQNG